MKINKIKTWGNPVLGDLELDFTNKDKKPFDTIILAGINGCGKSYLLNLIFEFSNLTIVNGRGKEKREFKITLSKNEIDALKIFSETSTHFKDGVKNNELNFYIDYSLKNSWNQIKVTFFNEAGAKKTIESHLLLQQEIKYIFRALFSDIGINFTPKNINTITSRDTDLTNTTSEKTGANLATDIAQLLVDIEALDSSDYKKWSEQNIDKIKKGTDPRKHMNKRMRRFSQAYRDMFGQRKKFLEIRNVGGKKVYFKEGSLEMPIEELSSGEKQIVFRAGFLLKDQQKLKEEIILIDEPEISLHPEWQLKILAFYKNLFKHTDGSQSSQLIIATHSPFIIHSLDKNDTVLILSKDRKGIIKNKRTSEFFGWKPEVAIKKAFNLNLIYSTEKPIVVTEGKSDYYLLGKAWGKLHPRTEIPFELIPSGLEEKVQERSGNAEQVRKSLEVVSNLYRPGKVVIGLFDNDREGNEQYKGLSKKIFENYDINKDIRKHKSKSIYGMLLPIPSHRKLFVTKGDMTQRYLEIEHFFEDPILINEGIKGETILDTAIFKLKSKKKTNFSKNVDKYHKSKFKEFEKIFDQIKKII